MPAHSTTEFSPYTPQQIFDLVVAVERYPEFLPWCRAARILERKEDHFLAELIISFKHFTESYVSRVTCDSPQRIEVEMVRGPFEFLVNRWQFTPMPEGGCQIDFMVDFRFRSKILEKLIGGLFGKATAKMAHAFKERADSLYVIKHCN